MMLHAEGHDKWYGWALTAAGVAGGASSWERFPGLPFTPTASPISDPLRVLSSLLISFGMLSSTSESAKAKRGCRLTLVIAQYRY